MPRRRRSTSAAIVTAFGAAALLLGILIAAACAVSVKWWFGYSSQSWLADIDGGTLYSKLTPPDQLCRAPGWYAGPNIDHANGHNWVWTWWAFGERDMPREKLQAHSVWPLVPLLTLTGAWLIARGGRAARRATRNQCRACGYPRAGLVDAARCPECGSTNTATVTSA